MQAHLLLTQWHLTKILFPKRLLVVGDQFM